MLTILYSISAPKNRLGRWAVYLSGWDFEIIYRKGIHHANVDAISRIPFKQLMNEAKASAIPPDNTVYASITELTRDREKFIQCQRQDPQSADIYQYLENRNLPDDDIHARAVILESYLYQLQDKLLYRIPFNAHTKHDVNAQLVIPKEYIDIVLEAHHDNIMSGHCGRNKLFSKIRERYYW